MLSELERYIDYLVVIGVAVLLYRMLGEPLKGAL